MLWCVGVEGGEWVGQGVGRGRGWGVRGLRVRVSGGRELWEKARVGCRGVGEGISWCVGW